MCKFFLYNQAIDIEDSNAFLKGMLTLSVIEKKSHAFYRHKSIYDIAAWEKLCSSNSLQERSHVLQFIEQLNICEKNFENEQEADEFWQTPNAFLGIDFSDTPISEAKQITNKEEFYKFLNDLIFKCDSMDFWHKKNDFFPDLSFSPKVERDIRKVGNSKYFTQILEELRTLNGIAKDWKTGSFNYSSVNQNYPIRVSPESQGTMAKYGNQRIFRLPEGGTQTFELHIKTGDLRFYFYPDKNKRKIYIGYIGPHLSTVNDP